MEKQRSGNEYLGTKVTIIISSFAAMIYALTTTNKMQQEVIAEVSFRYESVEGEGDFDEVNMGREELVKANKEVTDEELWAVQEFVKYIKGLIGELSEEYFLGPEIFDFSEVNNFYLEIITKILEAINAEGIQRLSLQVW